MSLSIHPLPSSGCEPACAHLLQADHVITALTCMDFFFTYCAVSHSVCETFARQTASHSRHPRALNTQGVTPSLCSMGSVGRVPCLACDILLCNLCSFAQSMPFALHVLFMLSLLRPAALCSHSVSGELLEVRCTPRIYPLRWLSGYELRSTPFFLQTFFMLSLCP